MSGDPEFVILKHSAWLDAAKYESKILGAVVRQPLKPTNDYLPENPLQYNDFDLVEPSEPLTDFVLENSNIKAAHASAKLSSIGSFSFKGETTESIKLAGKLIRYKRLQQHSQFWSKLKEDKAVGAKIPTWVADAKTWPPCLVVGIMIAEDVDLDFGGASQREKTGGVELPLAKIAMAATGAPVPTDVGDLQLDAGKTRGHASVFKAKAAKSNIFALELQIVAVTKSLFKSKRQLVLSDDGPEVDTGRLAGIGDDDSEDEALPSVDDLVLQGFTDEDYAQMAG
ncbi:hypothetical protein N0V83_005806 [Neocucurbitaria cava]|uniref:Uncharacterized protein n=1 Tax=Neocucurbitaria cava TaxID=798079 RepID=A0A9W8Y831_9PLEO|nr:hypothetical protein N0V83_005806 [Neocucurbitaria cava]